MGKNGLFRAGNNDVKVVVGTNQLSEGGETYKSDFVYANPEYTPSIFANDVGLIRVSKEIVFSEKVQPVTLPSSDLVKENYPATLSGWGSIRVSLGPILYKYFLFKKLKNRKKSVFLEKLMKISIFF